MAKRFIALLLITCMICLLCACTPEKKEGNPADDATGTQQNSSTSPGGNSDTAIDNSFEEIGSSSDGNETSSSGMGSVSEDSGSSSSGDTSSDSGNASSGEGSSSSNPDDAEEEEETETTETTTGGDDWSLPEF